MQTHSLSASTDVAGAVALSLVGLKCTPVRVGVSLTAATPGMLKMGDDVSSRETRVRVRSALTSIGVGIDDVSLSVHVDPEPRKPGTSFDVAVAVAILRAIGTARRETMGNVAFVGELSLSGAVRLCRGVTSQVLGASKCGIRTIVVPQACGAEAASAADGLDVDVRVASSLGEIVKWLNGEAELAKAQRSTHVSSADPVDMSDIRGHAIARRGLEIAAAGGHNILFIGSPGTGKTMFARRITTILPPMSAAESLETTELHSVSGLLNPEHGTVSVRPFRAPHHTINTHGLVGGGDPVRPGELSLAHNGVLLLDEIAEFKRGAIEPAATFARDGEVTICRSSARTRFPASPMLVLASNPCPCGFYGAVGHVCTCSDERRAAYISRVFAMPFPRVDIHVNLNASAAGPKGDCESSETVRQRVSAARAAQLARFNGRLVSAKLNAFMSPLDLEHAACLDDSGREAYLSTVERFGLGQKTRSALLRVARTIADLANSESINDAHWAEATLFWPQFAPGVSLAGVES